MIGAAALLLAGCSTPAPQPDIIAQANARLAAQREQALDAPWEPVPITAPQVEPIASVPSADSGRDVTLQIDVTPAAAEVWLLRDEYDVYPHLIPSRRAGIVSGFEIPKELSRQRAVLYVQHPRHIPMAYQFVPAEKNTFKIVLPELPALGFVGPEGDEQGLADLIRVSKLTEAGRVRDRESKAMAAREHAIAKHPEWPVEWRNAIRNQRIVAGMNQDAVFLAWGRALSKTIQGGIGGSSEIWYYSRATEGSATLFFIEGKLVRWSMHQ